MVSRVWPGRKTPENADTYEELLKTQVFLGITAKGVAGYRRIELFRRPLMDEIEFITVMGFDSLEAVWAFAGGDYETAYAPPEARAVLERFDARSAHYEVRETIGY